MKAMDCNFLLSSMSRNFYFATLSVTWCVTIAGYFSQRIHFPLGLMSWTIPHVTWMSLSVWGPFSNAWKCFAYYNCYKALNIIISLIILFILSLEYCLLPISTMVRGNIILAWQRSETFIHIYKWSRISHFNIYNGLGQHYTSVSKVWDIRSHLWIARDFTP